MKKIFLTILILMISEIAFACSCVNPEKAQIELTKADAVFTGRVIKIEDAKNFGHNVKFKVLKPYKGILDEFVIVNTGFGNGDCGYPFKEDEEYLVYAYSHQEAFSTSICSRTKHLSAASEDLAQLDKMIIR